jgi:UDP-N-acetylmuramate: L-alanyl-gamma-D-glutamyl-meso-diaminopimelate ligase
MVAKSFGDNVSVLTKTEEVLSFLQSINQWDNHVLLMMSSGNFDGIDYAKLGSEISFKLN